MNMVACYSREMVHFSKKETNFFCVSLIVKMQMFNKHHIFVLNKSSQFQGTESEKNFKIRSTVEGKIRACENTRWCIVVRVRARTELRWVRRGQHQATRENPGGSFVRSFVRYNTSLTAIVS